MSGSGEPLSIEANEAMEHMLRDIQGQLHHLRGTLTRLENIGLFMPIEVRAFQVESPTISGALKT